MLQYLNNANFKETLRTNEVVLVDFYADWCGPCQAIHPVLEDLSSEFDGKATVAKMNVDLYPELSSEFGIKSIPTLLYFNKGELVKRHAGIKSKQALKEEIENLVAA